MFGWRPLSKDPNIQSGVEPPHSKIIATGGTSMFTKYRALGLVMTFLLFAVAGVRTEEQKKGRKQELPILGRWDIIVQSPDGQYPSWLEVRRSGYRTLVGSFVGQFGSARPISHVEFDNGRLRFSIPPQWEQRQDDLQFVGEVEGDGLRGQTTDDKGRRVTWTA